MPNQQRTSNLTTPHQEEKTTARPPERSLSTSGRLLRICEGIVLFGLPPFLLWRGDIGLRFAFPLLFVSTALALLFLLLDPAFDRQQLWRIRSLAAEWKRILLIYTISVPAMITFTWLIDVGYYPIGPSQQNLLFGFPSRAPQTWLIVMFLYPILSVYPQEILFRTFLFHRYERAFGSTLPIIIFSALAFGWMHVFFGNPIAVPLTILSGALHAWTYARSRSTAAAVLEHALYGNAAFTIGLGWFFFTGSIPN